MACACLLLFLRMCERVFVYSFAKCTIVQHSGDCACLSWFSTTRGKERDRDQIREQLEYLRNLTKKKSG